jgi:pilus assembly protein CpaB
MSNACSSTCNMWRKSIVFAAAIAIGGWAILTALDRHNTPPKPETIEICVAAKDLPVGTTIVPEDVATCVTRASVPKDSVPDTAVFNETDLHDKRLARPLRKGEAFNRQDFLRLSYMGALPPGGKVVTIQYLAGGTFVTVGDWVAIIAKIRRGNELELVALARGLVVEDTWGDPHSAATIIVTTESGKLIELAQARGCDFSLMVTDHEKARDSEPVDVERTKKLLESLPVTTPTEP